MPRVRIETLLRWGMHGLAVLPALWLAWDYAHGNLTANPIQALTQRTGKTALILLAASLVCSPFTAIFDYKPVLRLRRPLGLYAFIYAAGHFLVFAGLDYGFDAELVASEAFFSKPYIVVGLSALLILTALAFTSARFWMQRLGKMWKRLHQLVYLAAPLVVVHYIWSVKSDYREPALYGVFIGLLLLARVPAVRQAARRALAGFRRSPRKAAVSKVVRAQAVPPGEPSR